MQLYRNEPQALRSRVVADSPSYLSCTIDMLVLPHDCTLLRTERQAQRCRV